MMSQGLWAARKCILAEQGSHEVRPGANQPGDSPGIAKDYGF